MATNSLIRKRNDLIQSSYALSIAETRVILLCIAKIDSRQPLALDHEFTVTASDFNDELGLDAINAYEHLQAAVDRLWKREILIDPENPASMVRWITKKAYFTAKGSVNIAFSAQIMPFLTELKERYTSYSLKHVARFNNTYSIRVYELLVQFKKNQERKISVLDFRAMLNLGEKYSAIKDLKKRVVTPALNDINEHSNVTVELDQEKQGKVVTHLIFKYSISEETAKSKGATKYSKPKAYTPAPDMTSEQKEAHLKSLKEMEAQQAKKAGHKSTKALK